MHYEPLPGEAGRRRAEEQLKTKKKFASEPEPNTPAGRQYSGIRIFAPE
jgi:hypothetical protein